MTKKYFHKKAKNFEPKKLMISLIACMCVASGMLAFAGSCLGADQYSPVVGKLYELYRQDPEIIDKALANAVTPPTGVCSTSPVTGDPFCWKGKSIKDMLAFFESWLDSVPTPQNDGFGYYRLFYDLCYNNLYAVQFVETEPWLSWTRDFTKARGEKMDSPVDPKIIDQWKEFLGKQWDDYIVPEGGFKTFNQFFTRRITDKARPVFGDDTILAAPADSLINAINSNLTATTRINTKYEESLNIGQLLDGSEHAGAFNGGTAISCVLLPTVYHWYHAPVGGTVIESRAIPGTSFGMNGGFYTFANNGNFGGYKASFGVFGIYHRGYYIIETEKYGLVAMIPVGLDDVNSVNFAPQVGDIPEKNPAKKIKKGEPLGYFAYGGSVVILLFEPGVFTGLKVRQGQQVGIINPINP